MFFDKKMELVFFRNFGEAGTDLASLMYPNQH